MPAGTTTGVRGASLDGDRIGAGSARAAGLRKTGLSRAIGTKAPFGRSRGGTPTGERPLQGARRANAELGNSRLPAFRFLFSWRGFLACRDRDRDGAGPTAGVA